MWNECKEGERRGREQESKRERGLASGITEAN